MYFLRTPKGEHGRLHLARVDRPFVESLPLVMHERCADANGCGGHPWDPGREAFSELAGQPLCWDRGEWGAPCFWCGETA
jgi:hypothetical protein